MAAQKKIIDISDELILQRWGNGIKLGRPDHQKNPAQYPAFTVNDILKSDFHVYFLNRDNIAQNLNESGASALGITSIKSFIGHTPLSLVTKECAMRLKQSNNQVFSTNKIIFSDEDLIVKDNILNTFAIKAPWYDSENNMIGLMGCSIEVGKQSLVHSLSKITQMGLLTPFKSSLTQSNMLQGIQIGNVYLSKRQREILHFIIRGKTIKEIAYLLGLSQRTVGHYFETIKMKMGVFSKSELIDKVIDHFIKN